MSQAGPSKARKGSSTRRQNDFSVLNRESCDSTGASFTRIPSISTNPTLPSTSNPLSDLVEFGGFVDEDDHSETITTSKYRTRASISSLSGFQYSFERSHRVNGNGPHVLPASNHPHPHPHHSYQHQPQVTQLHQVQRSHQSTRTRWDPVPPPYKRPVFDVESDFERAASDSCDEEPASSTSASDLEIQRLRQELASMKRVSVHSLLIIPGSCSDGIFESRAN
jgi:hypothetical protein